MGTWRKGEWPNEYFWTGPIDDGLAPGRRTVEMLQVRKVGDVGPEGLRILERFPDLQELSIIDAGTVHLDALRGLPIRNLALSGIERVGLAPVGDLEVLRDLSISDCEIVGRRPVALPGTLEALFLSFGDRPSLLPGVVSALDWESACGLRTLRVGGDLEDPVRCDLSFLRHLPNLVQLFLYLGVWHSGDGPSPLDPPFEGLSRKLEWIRIDAWEPDVVAPALGQYLGRPGDPPRVWQRYAPPTERRAPWAPFEDPSGWQIYGALYDWAPEGVETEYDAADLAIERVTAADPALAERVEFDPENAGTGIYARDREDLERVRSILGLDG